VEAQTVKTVSATEAKNRLGSLINDVARGHGAIAIERHGHSQVVVVSAAEWAEVTEIRERLRRKEAWEELMALAREVSARNADLTQEEIDAMADDVGREAVANVVARTRYKREAVLR
jgi:prevent-host-death family protein